MAQGATAQGPGALGGEFQVNTYTLADQSFPSVAVRRTGDFVIAWHSDGSFGSDDSGYSIQAQRYREDGTPIDDQFQVNTFTTGSQANPAILAAPDGRTLVLWDGVEGQWFQADGSPLGDEFHVSDGFHSSVAIAGSGEFLVVWEDFDTSADGEVNGQRFDAAGHPVGGEFQINVFTTGYQARPEVASTPAGEFIVTWFSQGSAGSDTDDFSIQARRYDADGTPLTGEFQVNTYTTSYQMYSRVAVDAEGNFLIVWSSPPGRRGQLFDADGDPAGEEFTINELPDGEIFYHAWVAADPEDGFWVTWESTTSSGSDSSQTSIQARRIDGTGTPVGEQFQVNSYTTSRQKNPVVATRGGDFVIAWESRGNDGSEYGVAAQRYAGPSLFRDGFESGDASSW